MFQLILVVLSHGPMFQLSTYFIESYIANVVAAMNKLSRLICVLLAGSLVAIYFLTHLGYLDLESSDEFYEDIIVLPTVSYSRTHKPPVTKPSDHGIILTQAQPNNLSSMVNSI